MKTILWVLAAVAVGLAAVTGFLRWQNQALGARSGFRPAQVCEAQAQFNQEWTRVHLRPSY